MSQKWGFYFDQNRCIGCKTCVTACKNWNDRLRGDAAINIRESDENYMAENGQLDNGRLYIDTDTGETNYKLTRRFYMKENWRRIIELEKGSVTIDPKTFTFDAALDRKYLSIACNHCDEPACIAVCPMNCITKDPVFGAVLVQNGGCISCGRCKEACPWRAPQFYDDKYQSYAETDPKRPKMTKCTMCVDRIKENLKPACVAACWNRALDAGPIEELKAKYNAKGLNNEIEGFADSDIEPLGISTKPNIIFHKKQ